MTAASVAAQSRYPVTPYHYYAMIGSGHTPSRSVDAYWQDCDIPWLTTGDVKHLRSGVQQVISETEHQISRLGMENSAARLHPAGTVALSRTASVGFVAILGREMATSQDFVTWTPFESLDARYLLWVFRAMKGNGDFDRMMYGSTHKTIYYPQLQQLRGPLPSLEVQRRVADMLDVETARIDTLIAKNDSAQVLAHRHEMVAVSHEVGGGGMAGSRWPVGSLRWFDVDIQTGPFGSQLHANEYVTGGWPVCNPSNLIAGRLVPDTQVTVSDETQQRLARHQLRAGDIVFGRRGEMGRAALVTTAEEGWLCGTGSLRLRFLGTPRFVPDYLLELLGSWGVRAWFTKMAQGSTMQNLNEELLGSLPVPNVPLDEQRRILGRVRQLRARHEEMRGSMSRLSDLLRLRRQALITAAVTGQIDV